MVRRGEAQSLGVEAYERLRTELLGGRYVPGERLVAAELSARHGVKPGVMREALTRARADGLVTFEPNRGFRVMEADAAAIGDLLEVRRITEGAALRLAVERANAADEATAVAAHHRLSVAGPDDVSRAHHDFHLALLTACGNARLLELCESLFEASQLYRRWSAGPGSASAGPVAVDRAGEHARILEAVLAKDADLAVALHEQHLRRTVDLALAYAAERQVSPSPA